MSAPGVKDFFELPEPSQKAQAPGAFLPADTLWGWATAAPQIECAGEEEMKESGRGESIWDRLASKPGTVADGTSTMKTCNHYALWKEDVQMLKKLGTKAYRFSISWPRVIPLGGKDDPVNEKGLKFYNDLIDELLKEGIIPFVTIFHWDLPQALQDRYGGWTSREIVPDYLRYARLCFDTFGDRVQHWLTFNEPWCIAALGYGLGRFAPGHKNNTEPWLAGHHVLLCHSQATKIYRDEYKQRQRGQIGITLNGDWVIPYSDSQEDVEAAQRKMDFALGWFADPVYLTGDYPDSMKKLLGDRLPKFTPEESKLLLGSSDFYGCNTYTTHFIKEGGDNEMNGNTIDGFQNSKGEFMGVESPMDWLRSTPFGFRKLLNYLYKRYKTPIFMTENGFAIKGENDLGVEQAVHDQGRIDYYAGYLQGLKEAVVDDGVVIKSYFGWSLMDNFEWDSGLQIRMGSVHVDFDTYKRTPKDSCAFLKGFFTEALEK